MPQPIESGGNAPVIIPQRGNQPIVAPVNPVNVDPTPTDPKSGDPNYVAPDSGGGDQPIAFDATKFDKLSNSFITSKLQSVEGVFVNKTGDFVNEKGEVVLPKSTYDSELTAYKTSQLEGVNTYIDGLTSFVMLDKDNKEVNCTLDANKNVIGADGKIFMSKEQLASFLTDNYTVEELTAEGEDDDATITPEFINALSELSGFKALDENGNVVEFDSSLQGLAKREAYIINTEAGRLADELLNNFINKYPDLEDAINYVVSKGTLEGFNRGKDYSTVKVDKTNEAGMIDIILDAEMARGRTRQEAVRIVNAFKDGGILESMANDSLTYLAKLDKDRKDSIKEAAIDAENEKQALIQQRIKESTEIINNGKILNWTIPETIKVKQSNGIIKNVSRQAFIDFVTKPLENGYTADQILSSREDINQKLFISYLRFTGNDLTQLIDGLANSKIVERFKANKSVVKFGGSANRNNSNTSSFKPVAPIRRF
jgi:hypothetical protein